jgi:hypothetical protein
MTGLCRSCNALGCPMLASHDVGPHRPPIWLTVHACGYAITIDDYERQGSPSTEFPAGYYQVQCRCGSHVSVPSNRIRLIMDDAYGFGQLSLGGVR